LFGFVPIVQNDEFLKRREVSPFTVHILADSGLVAETPAPLNLMQEGDEEVAFVYGNNRGLLVRQLSPPVKVGQLCWILTTAGLQLLEFVEREAEPESMQLLVDIFRRFGLEPEVGSYALISDGENMEFTSDNERNSSPVATEGPASDRTDTSRSQKR
jgi:hypothetical protein